MSLARRSTRSTYLLSQSHENDDRRLFLPLHFSPQYSDQVGDVLVKVSDNCSIPEIVSWTMESEQPWHAAFPAPKMTKPASLSREEVLDILQREVAGRDFVLVDVRRQDYEVRFSLRS
jgi:hypothetical protein